MEEMMEKAKAVFFIGGKSPRGLLTNFKLFMSDSCQ
jgi:hypothetical protein